MNIEPMYLLHTKPDPRRLAAWAARHRLLSSQGDLGYALHALLQGVFKDKSLQTFRYLDEQDGLLAYTRLGPEEFERHIALADADVTSVLGLSATANQPGYSLRSFPSIWPVGHVLGFEVRVRPIIRESKSRKERDAFLSAIEKSEGRPVNREEVYLKWLSDQIKPRERQERAAWQGAVELINMRIDRYRLVDVMRQTQHGTPSNPLKRERRSVVGPEVVLSGQLRVQNSEAFASLLSRGIGRHRAFGFGMLLLRPAG